MFIFTHIFDSILFALGSYEDASDLTCIEKHGITHVFNCASGYTRTGPEFYGVKCEYYAIRAEDDREYNIMQHYEEGILKVKLLVIRQKFRCAFNMQIDKKKSYFY